MNIKLPLLLLLACVITIQGYEWVNVVFAYRGRSCTYKEGPYGKTGTERTLFLECVQNAKEKAFKCLYQGDPLRTCPSYKGHEIKYYTCLVEGLLKNPNSPCLSNTVKCANLCPGVVFSKLKGPNGNDEESLVFEKLMEYEEDEDN